MNNIEFDTKKQIIMDLVSHPEYRPLKIKEIAALLDIPQHDRHILDEVLQTLIAEGKLIKTKRSKYAVPEKLNLISGVFEGHPKGFGFVVVEEEENDIFIPGDNTNGALHKDKVLIKIVSEPSGRRKEGEVVQIVERGVTEVIGTFDKSSNFGFVIPDNPKLFKDIFVSKTNDKGAVTGHKVIVEITNYGNERRSPEGSITEIIGHVNDPGTDITSIVRGFNLPVDFPEAVMREVESIPAEVQEKELKNRLDIRDWQTVTIDGEDAKDLDDAITITKKPDGKYTLGVHIADVTHYVKENSFLDKEAITRATSVYLVDRVIPMLPHKLSNGICSLNANVDRLALSCIMDLDENGTVIGHKIEQTVINVDRRMTYTAVKKILEENDEETIAEYKELVPMFKDMEDLAMLLRTKRKQRGSIDFDFPESKIILNEQGEPIDIKAYDRNVATKIIEEFMLLANETIAEDYHWQELPFVYRTHELPDPEKIQKLGQFIYNFGYRIKGHKESIHPKEIQKLLSEIEGKPEEPIISRLALRSMKQARYTASNDGHFGLSAKYYTHFTSPIRRYPDLQIHRIIKQNLNGELNEKKIAHYKSILPQVTKQCSELERRAEEAERETNKLKKVEYMSKHIGEEFEGVISGVTSWGIYVELPNTVEGLVHVTALDDDYYIFDQEKYMFVGERTSKIYRIGDTVNIRVLGTDKIQKTIDFEMVE
ncbi:RNAse R [Natranaerovirga pectinivora]|uniref:Ribonuclease R n=1 Tax=Natranaerovirga pectinivora TaxID=682400 RepID=A0A4V2V0H7_9FIRM|nr:ribonuclease R [Natranaerovirga pectinivora]TCT16197.1 RNAse R [Natranaerovirga pectinivora]